MVKLQRELRHVSFFGLFKGLIVSCLVIHAYGCVSFQTNKLYRQYFKHTNISSFVRQLNMYGFHKVSDVFHTGSPDSPMWEFRHGNGSFRKGDVAGLRDIKRRASRHALIHRDSFSTHKANQSQPGTPAEAAMDGLDPRMANLEQSLYDMHNRLARMEDHNALLSSHCHVLAEGLARCHQVREITYTR